MCLSEIFAVLKFGTRIEAPGLEPQLLQFHIQKRIS